MGITFCFVKTKYSRRHACSPLRERLTYLHLAGVIQLVECQLPKLDVVGSSPIARSFVTSAVSVICESRPRAPVGAVSCWGTSWGTITPTSRLAQAATRHRWPVAGRKRLRLAARFRASRQPCLAPPGARDLGTRAGAWSSRDAP